MGTFWVHQLVLWAKLMLQLLLTWIPVVPPMTKGASFGFLGQWLYAALIWAGVLGCLVAVLSVLNKVEIKSAISMLGTKREIAA